MVNYWVSRISVNFELTHLSKSGKKNIFLEHFRFVSICFNSSRMSTWAKSKIWKLEWVTKFLQRHISFKGATTLEKGLRVNLKQVSLKVKTTRASQCLTLLISTYFPCLRPHLQRNHALFSRSKKASLLTVFQAKGLVSVQPHFALLAIKWLHVSKPPMLQPKKHPVTLPRSISPTRLILEIKEME